MSPKKKKIKISADESNTPKRQNSSEGASSKRAKSLKNNDEDLQAKKRKNFVTACQQVSFRAYLDDRARLLLLYFPPCMYQAICKHQANISIIRQMPAHVEEVFMINIRANMWCDALEVCILSITPTQYLSANILKEIVEIILNAHEDEEYTLTYLIPKCQQTLMQNFSMHPPCPVKQLRMSYKNFLTSPLDQKEKTFTNRNEFERDKGIVKYCMNRLEYEISSESKDESLVDKEKNTPQEMKKSVKGEHWQKEKFEIYEMLERTERIDRLMVILETIIEVLQFDLAMWHNRFTNNFGNHIMRSHKPLMAYILWSNNILYTGAVNNNCRQILKIFTQMVHLQYPEKYIKIMTTWINAVIQTFYYCETKSNSDYPNIGKYCLAFAKEFYKVISEMPHDSILRIIELIKPAYMKNLIGMKHLEHLLSTREDCAFRSLINFIKESKWRKFPKSECDIQISKDLFPKPVKVKSILRYLTKKCAKWMSESEDAPEDPGSIYYPKMDVHLDKKERPNRNHVVQTLYVTLEAYLDTYSIRDVQETLDSLNEKLEQNDDGDVSINTIDPEKKRSYSVTEQYIKKYKSIYQTLKELVLLLQELKSSGDMPDILKVFQNIDVLNV